MSVCMCVCLSVCPSFFISSSVRGHLACFLVLTIVNDAVMNIGVCESSWFGVFIFLDINPGVGLLDPVVVLFLVFSRNLCAFLYMAASVCILTGSVQGVPFLHTLVNICVCGLFLVAVLIDARWYLTVVLTCISLTRNVEHLLRCLECFENTPKPALSGRDFVNHGMSWVEIMNMIRWRK